MLPNSTTSWLEKRSRCASTLAPICLIQWRWQLKAVVFGAWGRAPWRSSPMALWCHCWRIWSSSLKLRAIASTSFFGKYSHLAMDRVSHFRVTWNLSRRSRKRRQQQQQLRRRRPRQQQRQPLRPPHQQPLLQRQRRQRPAAAVGRATQLAVKLKGVAHAAMASDQLWAAAPWNRHQNRRCRTGGTAQADLHAAKGAWSGRLKRTLSSELFQGLWRSCRPLQYATDIARGEHVGGALLSL